MRTGDEQCVGEGAEDGQDEAANNAGAHDSEQKLAAIGQELRGFEQHEAVDDEERGVATQAGGAGHDPVMLLALLALGDTPLAEHSLERPQPWLLLVLAGQH